MHEWELEMLTTAVKTAADLEQRNSRSRDRLRETFTKYCEAGEGARRLSDALHWGGHEPDYDPEKERITSVQPKGKSVVIETQMTHSFGFKLRYELVENGGQWKIRDNRKCRADFSTKWEQWDL